MVNVDSFERVTLFVVEAKSGFEFGGEGVDGGGDDEGFEGEEGEEGWEVGGGLRVGLQLAAG